MELWEKQSLFAQNVAKLIQYANSIRLNVTLGEAMRSKEQAEIYAKEGKGIEHSLHCERLAIDLNLFDEHGTYLTNAAPYKMLGDYWVTLHPLNRWGGIFKRVDLDHYEMQNL
jgi:hypothetical protein